MEHSTATWLLLADAWLADPVRAGAPDIGIDVVTGPSDFLARLTSHPPEVAVAAVPPADEPTILAFARAAAVHAVPGVLIDDPGAVDERLRALGAGLADALPADLDPRELVGRLRMLAARGRVPARALAGVIPLTADAVLDVTAHALVRAGHHVHLRPKELAMLRTMAGEPGRVFTRRELDERVWGDHRPESRRVDVHVRWLRMKLEPDPDVPRHLVTVRRVGYRLDLATLTSP